MANRTICVGLALAALALDQVTKFMARSQLAEPVLLGPFVDLRLSFNKGVSFGLLADSGELGRWLLVVGTAAVALWLLCLMWREAHLNIAASLALMAGGALGNIIDRVRMGEVTDFVDVHVGDAHWPTFNLADAAIILGLAGLLLAWIARPVAWTAPPISRVTRN